MGCRLARGDVHCCPMNRSPIPAVRYLIPLALIVVTLPACDLIGMGDSEPVAIEVAQQADQLSDQADLMDATATRAATKAQQLKEAYDVLQKEADEAKAAWEAMDKQAKDLKIQAGELKKRADTLSKQAAAMSK